LRPTRGWLWVGLGVVAAAVAAAVWVLRYWCSPPCPAPTTLFLAGAYRGKVPTFEEPLSPTPAGTTHRLTEAMFKALKGVGVEGASVHLMVRSDATVEHITMSGPLPPGLTPQRLRKALEEASTPWGAQVEVMLQDQRLVGWVRAGSVEYEINLAPGPVPGPSRGKVALVVDDLGYRLKPARELVALGIRITLSVLPWAPHAREVAAMAKAAGLEVLVHLPMQPRAYPRLNPGPGALMLGMSPAQITKLTMEAIARVPGAVGVNNHMGSAFTENPAAMATLLEVLKRKGLFFLDSLTSPRSCARKVAARVGLRFASRWLFIDHDPSPGAIRAQLKRLLRLGRLRAAVVAIAHPYPQTIAALKELAPRLKATLNLVGVAALARVPAPPRALARRPSGPRPSSHPSPHPP